jgi:hypothetical protein
VIARDNEEQGKLSQELFHSAKNKKAIQRHIGSYFDVFIKSDGMRKEFAVNLKKITIQE